MKCVRARPRRTPFLGGRPGAESKACDSAGGHAVGTSSDSASFAFAPGSENKRKVAEDQGGSRDGKWSLAAEALFLGFNVTPAETLMYSTLRDDVAVRLSQELPVPSLLCRTESGVCTLLVSSADLASQNIPVNHATLGTFHSVNDAFVNRLNAPPSSEDCLDDAEDGEKGEAAYANAEATDQDQQKVLDDGATAEAELAVMALWGYLKNSKNAKELFKGKGDQQRKAYTVFAAQAYDQIQAKIGRCARGACVPPMPWLAPLVLKCAPAWHANYERAVKKLTERNALRQTLAAANSAESVKNKNLPNALSKEELETLTVTILVSNALQRQEIFYGISLLPRTPSLDWLRFFGTRLGVDPKNGAGLLQHIDRELSPAGLRDPRFIDEARACFERHVQLIRDTTPTLHRYTQSDEVKENDKGKEGKEGKEGKGGKETRGGVEELESWAQSGELGECASLIVPFDKEYYNFILKSVENTQAKMLTMAKSMMYPGQILNFAQRAKLERMLYNARVHLDPDFTPNPADFSFIVPGARTMQRQPPPPARQELVPTKPVAEDEPEEEEEDDEEEKDEEEDKEEEEEKKVLEDDGDDDEDDNDNMSVVASIAQSSVMSDVNTVQSAMQSDVNSIVSTASVG